MHPEYYSKIVAGCYFIVCIDVTVCYCIVYIDYEVLGWFFGEESKWNIKEKKRSRID
jgi:hypothetical protein